MTNKTLIEWNADVGTRFLTIHPDGSFDIDKDAPPLFVIGELAKAFIRQQERIMLLEEAIQERDKEWFQVIESILGFHPVSMTEALRIGIERIKKQKQRIKRLEEAGDKAILNSYLPDRLAVWDKAKEASK